MEDVYYLVKFASLDSADDFRALVAEFSTYTGLEIVSVSSTSIRVTIQRDAAVFYLTLVEKPSIFQGDHTRVFELRCESNNLRQLNIVRPISEKFEYRIYSVQLGCFLPRGTIMPAILSHLPENAAKTFRIYGLEPVFFHFDDELVYARDKNGAIHIVNFGLFDYYVHFGIDKADSEEFSYVVADSLPLFVAMYDKGLMPASFYEYYRRNMRIMNFSEMNLWKVQRKIFIKPIVFYWDEIKQDFELLTADRVALNMADKIRPGENIQTAMERVLREELKMPTDYLVMRIGRQVEFDRDRENKLTPRLAVAVFYRKLDRIDPQVLAQTQRSWRSTDTVVN